VHLWPPDDVNSRYCPNCGSALQKKVKSISEEISDADRELLKLLKNPKIIEKLELLAKNIFYLF